jgi:hypothetical protein
MHNGDPATDGVEGKLADGADLYSIYNILIKLLDTSRQQWSRRIP